MEPRNSKLPALLGTLLILVAAHASADPHPPKANTVTKCIVAGTTSYSDQPCPDATTERPITGDNAVSVIASAKRPLRSARCDAAQAELQNINALTRQGQPPDMQAFLDARRQQKRNEQLRFRC